jgi:hypothetical protein
MKNQRAKMFLILGMALAFFVGNEKRIPKVEVSKCLR